MMLTQKRAKQAWGIVILAMVVCAVSAHAERRVFLSHVSLTIESGDDGLRDDSRIFVLVKYPGGRISAIPIPLVGSDARNAELHYDDLGNPPTFREGPVELIQAIGLRFQQGRGGDVRGTDNFTMSAMSVSLLGGSEFPSREVSVAFGVSHRFRSNEDYYPGGLSLVSRQLFCYLDSDCDDTLWCNGIERCNPNDPEADRRGCVGKPPCEQGVRCNETEEMCEPTCSQTPDRDMDGYASIECGGADCDDDPRRYPGNVELCDPENLDEDCNPFTFGDRDADSDGYVDHQCCNTSDDGTLRCGNDCNDLNAVDYPFAQTCGNQGSVRICYPNGEYWERSCGEGATCVYQPNSLGVCVPDNSCACQPSP
jgi:hypothetical protein